MNSAGNRRALREITHNRPLSISNFTNIMNVVHQLPPTPTSPDEEVIRLRGKKTSVLKCLDEIFEQHATPTTSRTRSPRKQTSSTPTRTSPRTPNKVSLSTPTRSSPRTPNKQAQTQPTRTSPRKRLNLGNDSTPECSTSGLNTPGKVAQQSKRRRCEKKPKPGNFETSLLALSQNQLVDLLKVLIKKHPNIEQDIIETLPAPDLEPLEQQLKYLQKNINKSFPFVRWGSSRDAFCYRRVRTHLEAFQKVCIDQGKHLVNIQHWNAVIDYVIMAWGYVLQMPDWDNPPHNKIKSMCFKGLAGQAMSALKKSKSYFEKQELQDITERLVELEPDLHETMKPVIAHAKQLVEKCK